MRILLIFMMYENFTPILIKIWFDLCYFCGLQMPLDVTLRPPFQLVGLFQQILFVVYYYEVNLLVSRWFLGHQISSLFIIVNRLLFRRRLYGFLSVFIV